MTKVEVLKQCTVENNIVKLPDVQLDRKLYQEVAGAIQAIGGKWKGGKVAGFVFPSGYESKIEELLGKVASGESTNLKKDFQFFATPAALADRLVQMAVICNTDLVLEPSAGQGAIIEAIQRNVNLIIPVDYIELMDINRTILSSKKLRAEQLIVNDFLDLEDSENEYDVIVANPPFTKNQDIDHIRKMYSVLKTGGRIVTLASTSWQHGSQKKQIAFREWLESIDAEISPVEAGAFKESGTMVPTVIIEINK